LFTTIITYFFIHAICAQVCNQIVIDEFPLDKQLYARDLNTHTANVLVSGNIQSCEYQSLELQVYREGVLIDTQIEMLNYVNGVASFSFSYPLLAERANYRFDLFGFNGVMLSLVRSASEVVAGDVLIIAGQSNAESKMWNGSSAAYIDSFVRVFGNALLSVPEVWYIGQGDGDRNSNGNTGQWGLVLAHSISMIEGIPIAIFNGAHGGTPISFHQRIDANPTHLGSNYGRLLYRLRETNTDLAVRSIIWYQGENDGNQTASYYETYFDMLYNDWKIDYPNVEQFYMIQVRSGCGGGYSAMINIQEAQRNQSAIKSDVNLMTSKGLATDGCHYPFTEGYEILGERMAKLILNDLYNGSNPDAEAPSIVKANINPADPTKIELTIAGADSLYLDQNINGEFVMLNNNILGVNVLSNTKLSLQLEDALTGPDSITLFDKTPTQVTPHVYDTNGIGLASFKFFPIEGSCTTIVDEDFEAGPGIWQSNGSNAMYTNNNYSTSGNFSFLIRGVASDTSSFTNTQLDLSSGFNCKISFKFLTRNLGPGESFYLQASDDGGQSFFTLKEWFVSIDFLNLIENEVQLMTNLNSTMSVFKFGASGSANSDEVYIDDILISSCPIYCETELRVTDNSSITSSTSVWEFIETNGIVNTDDNIRYTAEDYILMTTGFTVHHGAVFNAFIAQCE